MKYCYESGSHLHTNREQSLSLVISISMCIVRFPPMSKGNYRCVLRSFFLVRFLQYPTPTNQSFTSSHHRRHCPRAFDHGRGQRFHHLRTPTPPQKGRVFSLSNQRGTDITPRNPVQSGQRLPQRTDHPTPTRGRDKNHRAPLSVRWSWVGIFREERGHDCS